MPFIFNFNPTKSFEGYGFIMKTGMYKVVFNSDEKRYGGYNRLDDKIIYKADYVRDKYDEIPKLFIYLPSRTVIVLKRLK